MDTEVVQLPGGWLDSTGAWYREAVITPLTGREEELLAAATGTPAQLVTAVIARCVERIGPVTVTEQVARELTVGDRQTLLLRLREATFGPQVTGVVTCPWRGCGARMDLDFRTTNVPVRTRGDGGPVHELLMSEAAVNEGAEAGRRVRFRLPTGADQEAVGELARTDPAAAWSALLDLCVVAIDDGCPPPATWVSALSPLARQEIEQAMAAVAYGPDLSFKATCPECERMFTLPFDIQDFFFGELRATPELLLREVHYLAYHYHWSEDAILAMPRDRRQRYIDVLAEEIDRINDALD